MRLSSEQVLTDRVILTLNQYKSMHVNAVFEAPLAVCVSRGLGRSLLSRVSYQPRYLGLLYQGGWLHVARVRKCTVSHTEISTFCFNVKGFFAVCNVRGYLDDNKWCVCLAHGWICSRKAWNRFPLFYTWHCRVTICTTRLPCLDNVITYWNRRIRGRYRMDSPRFGSGE